MSGERNPRAAAALAISQVVFRGQQLNRILDRQLAECATTDRGLVAELTYGVVRWFWRLECDLNQVLHRSLRTKDRDLLCLLCVGVYQLRFMRIPFYASVSETVSATAALGKPWARGFVNAVLRKFPNAEAPHELDSCSQACRYAHPQWMIDRISREWPDRWRQILTANNSRPAMTLRVNVNKSSVADYIRRLSAAGIRSHVDRGAPTALRLEERLTVESLPGFDDGTVSVQSAASQMAALTADLAPSQRVLDACSAPGGKLLHMFEIQPGLKEVVAVDIDRTRNREIVDNLARASCGAQVITGDATCPHDWWDGKPFDRILVDAPCSAFGVISKHPDIKHHRRAEDINKMAARQHQLLKALLPLLKANGKLLYTTCSILAQENDDQIEHILRNYPDLVNDELPAALGEKTLFGRQRLPGETGGDGFYYARLSRR